MPNAKKKDDDIDLIRQPKGDVAEYKRDTHTGNPNISRSRGATTIVPRGGEIDEELKPQTQVKDASLGQEQYMADGGLAGLNFPDVNSIPSSFDVNSYTDTIKQGGNTPIAPASIAPAPNPMLAAPEPPPTSVAPIPKLPSAPQKPLAGMPPSVTPDELEKYLATQKTQIGKYGPDQEMELQNSLNAQRNGLGYKAADAGKGFADALMMGVARAGNPGWQQQFEGQQNERAKEQMDTLRHAQDTNMKQVETGMSLDKMNPNSALSRSTKQAYAPLMQKLGYSPASLEKMSAADIGNAVTLMSEYGGKELEAQIKAYEMAIEGQRTQAALANVQSESENRLAQRKMEEKKMKLEYPIMSMFSGTANDQNAPAESGPYGPTVQRNGKTYEWSPVSKQYHPAGK